MNDPLRVAVIGCGRFARVHLDILSASPLFEIRALVDVNPDAAREAAGLYRVARWETDHRALLADPEIEAFCIYTPAREHAAPTINALRAGKHVYCEKPMALTVADARAMADAARESGRVLQIGYVLRHSADAQNLRRLIVEGRIGRPVFYRDIWALAKGNPAPSAHETALAGGILFEQSSHVLDFLSWTFGPARRVFGTSMRLKPDPTSADDTFAAIVEFESGDKALISNSWAAKGMGWDVPTVGRKGIRPTLDVIGPKGSLHFPGPNGERVLSLYESKDQDGPPTEQWEWEQDWGATREGYAEEILRFRTCVREGAIPNPGAQEALAATSLAETVRSFTQ